MRASPVAQDRTRQWTDGEREAFGLGLIAAAAAKARARQGNGALDDVPLTGESAMNLTERPMEPLNYLCAPWIIEGLNLFAGRPKLGKTTMLRQKLAAVAGGGELFGERCEAAPCLFLSLEEGERLSRQKFIMAKFPSGALANIECFFQWRRGADGVLDLERYLAKHPEVRYIGIDSLTKVRSIPDHRMPAFMADYEAMSALHGIAKAHLGLCIEVVHHTRKMKSDDPLDDISGTFGLSAACDSYWVMRHHEDGAVLHVGGRLWERDVSQYQLTRGAQRWELLGEFTGLSQLQQDTLTTLRVSSGQGPTDCAKFWGISKSSAKDRLDSLVNRGVAYCKGGIYYCK